MLLHRFTPPPAPYVSSIPHHPALLPPPPPLGRDGWLWLQAPPTSILSAEEEQHDCVEGTNGELSAWVGGAWDWIKADE